MALVRLLSRGTTPGGTVLMRKGAARRAGGDLDVVHASDPSGSRVA